MGGTLHHAKSPRAVAPEHAVGELAWTNDEARHPNEPLGLRFCKLMITRHGIDG
jgi:hypothetical protein